MFLNVGTYSLFAELEAIISRRNTRMSWEDFRISARFGEYFKIKVDSSWLEA